MSTTLTAPPPAPSPTDSVEDFNAKAFALNAWFQTHVVEANELGEEMQINADVAANLLLAMALPQFAGTSSSSLAIGAGTKSFATQTGKGWLAGQIVVASNGGNYMKGTVAAYNSGTGALDLTITSTNGSGTFSSWTLGLSYDGLALVSKGAITTSGLTQATNRLLGRSTAGSGSVEEISVGSKLTLAGGVLDVATPVTSMVRLNTANGYGSTNTKIRRFTNTVTSTGTDITYTDSATLGASFTINTAGRYAITYTDNFNATGTAGLSLNTTAPTTNVYAIPAAELLASNTSGSGNWNTSVPWTGDLPAGSVIRPHNDGVASGIYPAAQQFTIVRLS